MKYYIIAGEASGDLHGGNLIQHLKDKDPQANIRAWGGEKMEKAGAVIVKHYRDLAFMGFAEVLMNLRTIFRNLVFCKKDIRAFAPDAVILIDYPGFNLRIAQWAHQHHYRTIYYISPQVWAWKESRVKQMKKNIDKMLVILPFEADYFQKRWNWKVTYVGHPLVNVIEKRSPEPLRIGNDLYAPTQKVIALLPGSRKQEIAQKLPVMLQVSALLPKEIFVVAKAPGIDDPFYASFLNDYANVLAVRDQTYSLLKHAKAALVTSGTATLETALFGVPQVVCYKGNALSYWIAKKMLTIRYIALVNLILNKPVVKELIQHDFTVEKLLIELNELLGNPVRRAAIDADYAVLKQMLQQNGHDASRKAAEEIITHLRT